MTRDALRPLGWALSLGFGLGAMLLLGCLPPGLPRPEPFLIWMVPIALRWGNPTAWVWALMAGLLVSFFEPGPTGTYALVYFGLGWSLGSLGQEQRNLQAIAAVLVVLTAAATVALVLGLAGLSLWTGRGPDLARLQDWMPGALACNLVGVFICERVLRRLHPRRVRY